MSFKVLSLKKITLLLVAALTLSACGTYEQSSYYDRMDNDYNRAYTNDNYPQETTEETGYFKNYFEEKGALYESVRSTNYSAGDEFFTDVENYSTSAEVINDTVPKAANYSTEYRPNYGGWG
ncbi:MAG: hypothetical protein RQ756_08450, partial [Flavobacteriaceae bacterium]|nr:hypothetical protein [Flavobacteriaceae bacterium]